MTSYGRGKRRERGPGPLISDDRCIPERAASENASNDIRRDRTSRPAVVQHRAGRSATWQRLSSGRARRRMVEQRGRQGNVCRGLLPPPRASQSAAKNSARERRSPWPAVCRSAAIGSARALCSRARDNSCKISVRRRGAMLDTPHVGHTTMSGRRAPPDCQAIFRGRRVQPRKRKGRLVEVPRAGLGSAVYKAAARSSVARPPRPIGWSCDALLGDERRVCEAAVSPARERAMPESPPRRSPRSFDLREPDRQNPTPRGRRPSRLQVAECRVIGTRSLGGAATRFHTPPPGFGDAEDDRHALVRRPLKVRSNPATAPADGCLGASAPPARITAPLSRTLRQAVRHSPSAPRPKAPARPGRRSQRCREPRPSPE
jgi:hypothetical protein